MYASASDHGLLFSISFFSNMNREYTFRSKCIRSEVNAARRNYETESAQPILIQLPQQHQQQ